MFESAARNETKESSAACCAEFYEQDWVQDLLGESFHPGGPDLSARLVHGLNLSKGARVLDVACGIGTTTLMMARQFGIDPVGIDFSETNIEKAKRASGQSAPAQVEFLQQSADALLFPDESFDAIVCECAFSTFSDQSRVADEFARVLKPGGAVGVTDMVVEGELPQDVAQRLAPWTCMTNARTVTGYSQLFLDAGLPVAHYVDESQTLLDLVATLKRKLLMAGVSKAMGALSGLNLELPAVRGLLDRAKQLVEAGTVQYCRMVFAKGGSRHPIPPSEVVQTVSNSACDCPPGTCC